MVEYRLMVRVPYEADDAFDASLIQDKIVNLLTLEGFEPDKIERRTDG